MKNFSYPLPPSNSEKILLPYRKHIERIQVYLSDKIIQPRSQLLKIRNESRAVATMKILDGHKVSNYLCAKLDWAWRAKLLKFEAIFTQKCLRKALFWEKSINIDMAVATMQTSERPGVSKYPRAHLGWARRAKLLNFDAIFRQKIPYRST